MTLETVLSHFQHVEKRGDGKYQCRCPAHRDKEASLSISQGRNGKIVMYCHAGCETKDILSAAGLDMSDINGERKEITWKSRIEYGVKQRHGDGAHILDIYDYVTASGKYQYSKVRFVGGDIKGKEIRYYRIDRKADEYKAGKSDKGHEAPRVLYRLPELIRAVNEGYPVYIVEGEKDVETLRKKCHWTATTAGGAKDWRPEFAEYFKGARVVILPDNDEPGRTLCEQIQHDIKNYAFAVKVVQTAKADKGDVTDYLEKEGGTPEGLKELIRDENRNPWHYAEWVTVAESKNGNRNVKINDDRLADNIARNEHYLMVRRPDDERDDIYLYENGTYSRTNKAGVKTMIRKYIPIGYASDTKLNNIFGLILARGLHRCRYSDMNADSRYINVKNGLYNIRTKELEPHNPEIKSTLQLNTEYDPDATNKPNFDKYINDLCRDVDGVVDENRKATIQEYFGLVFSNIPMYYTKKCLVLYSSIGNTGKSVLLNFAGDLLGEERIANIPISEMNEKNRFSMGTLIDKRLISVGDQTGAEVSDSAVFKQITGGDPVKIEAKGKQAFFYRYTGGMAFACNSLPYFSDDRGSHLFGRLEIVPCDHYIRPEDRDARIFDKMKAEKPAILNWFLEGLQRTMKNNYRLTESLSTKQVVTEYRQKLDTVFRFVTENYTQTGLHDDVVSKAEFDNAYLQWCKAGDGENSYKAVSKNNLGDRMASIGIQTAKGNIGDRRGVMIYRGIKLKDDNFHELSEEERMSLPF